MKINTYNKRIRRKTQDEIVVEKYTQQTVRRTFKLSMLALMKEFGFGKKRLDRYLNAFDEMSKIAIEDEVFWEHSNRILIEKYGFNFEKDWSD